jgi:hypothetical protein
MVGIAGMDKTPWGTHLPAINILMVESLADV